jgi:hypothetical protein
MKKAISYCFLGFVALLMPMDARQASHANEDTLIKRAVEDLYIKGLQTRDFGLIETVCIPETNLMSADRDGEFHLTTLQKWSKRFDPANPPFNELDYAIVKIDREGTAAQVKIAFTVDSSRQVTDFLHMLKLGGEWRIVNIIDF